MNHYASNYDLRQFDGPIRSQENLGSCTAFATTSIIDTMMRQAGHELPLLSPLAFYGEERTAMNLYNYDVGASAAALIYASTQKGFLYESDVPYDVSKFNVKPSAELLAQEYNNHATSWTYISSSQTVAGMVDTVKMFLSQGKPLELFFTPQSYFYQELGPLNTLQGYGPHNAEAKHAVEIIGCDDNLNGGSYIIHNSWDTTWADNGYGVISYKQFTPNFDHTEIQGFYVMNGFVHNGTTYDFTYSPERITVNTEYTTILGRAAEIQGLDWWSNILKNGTSKVALADALVNSAEGQLQYKTLDDEHFVEAVYHNVLGRDGEAAGVKYWSDALGTGISRGTLFSTFIDAVNAPKGESHDLLTNKVNLADYITIALHYDSSTDVKNEYVHNLLATVTADYNATEVLKVGVADVIHAVA